MPAAVVAEPDAIQHDISFGREPNPMMLAWFQGEFAAANAIIDALCSHMLQIARLQQEHGVEHVSSHEYNEVLLAIYKRRMNWIPVLHTQKYFSIADVSTQLQHVLENKKRRAIEPRINSVDQQQCIPNQHQQLTTSCSCCCCSCGRREGEKNKQEKANKVVLLNEDQHHGHLQGRSPDQNTSAANIVLNNPSESNRPASTAASISAGVNNTAVDSSCYLMARFYFCYLLPSPSGLCSKNLDMIVPCLRHLLHFDCELKGVYCKNIAQQIQYITDKKDHISIQLK